MSIDIDYFLSIQNSVGFDTERDVRVSEEKRNIAWELETSIHLEKDAKRNGMRQRFVITQTKEANKCNIIAFPDEELYAGDYIECFNHTWLVTEVKAVDTFHLSGTIVLCNFILKFQTNKPYIFERWGILDSGVYSTTIAGEKPVYYPNAQYKVYLPLDYETRQLYIDKRFAVERIVDQNGREIMSTYKFTAFDGVSSSNRIGDHLLLMKAKSDEYDPLRDNLELMVCDYISPQSEADNEGWY